MLLPLAASREPPQADLLAQNLATNSGFPVEVRSRYGSFLDIRVSWAAGVTEASKESDPLIGQLVTSRYRIVRKLGEGGMGTVYEAFHEAIEKKVALKILHSEYSASRDIVERFKQEAISASRIKHQNVIDVFDFGQLEDGACFIAMEFLDGVDLGDALQKRGVFSADDAIRVSVQICRALSLAHTRGVVHRDMKPENVFLQRTPEGDELVKILDFGIAQLRKPEDAEVASQRQRRLTKTGMIFGTPEYMAPEQARGLDVDQRSDVYATGIIVYELLTGSVPFMGESFLDVLNKHIMAKVPVMAEANPHVTISRELQSVVMKALEKAPDDRYPTMKEFSNALLRTPEGRAVRARISSISSRDEVDFDDPMRIENQVIPSSLRGAGTAVLGSPGTKMTSAMDAVPTHSSRGLMITVVTVSAGVLGLIVYTVLGGDKKSAITEDASYETQVVGTQLKEPTVADEERGEKPPEVSDASTSLTDEVVKADEVVLHVTTTPEGGVVHKDGFQVCDAAPCDVTVKVGEAVTLSADKGLAKGESKVLAQKDQKVTIILSVPSVARPRPAPKPQTEALCEVMVDGIKILRPCQ